MPSSNTLNGGNVKKAGTAVDHAADTAVRNSYRPGGGLKDLGIAEDAASAAAGEALPGPAGASARPSTLDTVEGKTALLWNIPFAGMVGGGIYKLGRAMGVVGKPVKAIGRALSTPNELLETHNIADLTHGISSATSYIGDKTGSQTLQDVGGTIAEKESAVRGRVATVATEKLGALGEQVESQIQRHGVLSRFRDRRVQKALKQQSQAMELAQTTHATSLEALGQLESSLQGKPAFARVHGVIVAARHDMQQFPAAIDSKTLALRAKQLKTHEHALHEALKEVKQTAKSRQPVLVGASKELTRQEHSARRAEYKAIKAAVKNTGKQFAAFSGAVDTVHNHLGTAESKAFTAKFADFKTGLSSFPEHLAKMNGAEALNTGLYGVQQGITGIRTADSFGDSFGMFREMNADASGKRPKDVSLLTTALQLAYVAKVPSELKEARSQFWRSAGPRLLAGTVGMVAFSKVMSRSAGMATQLLGFGLQQGAAKLGEKVASYNAELETYHAVREAWKKEGHLDKGAYAGLIIQAHKADTLEETDPRLAIVTAQYAQENLSPDGVLKEIASGKFAKRLAAAKQEPELKITPADNKMLSSMGIAKEPVSDAASVVPAGSALAKLAGKGAITEEQIIGKHTGNEAARRDGASVTSGLSPQPA